MALILLVLGAYLLIVEIPHEKKAREAEQNADRLFKFESADVDTVELRYPNAEIELRKAKDGNWSLAKPLQTEADQREVQSLISTIADIRYNRVVEEQAGNLDEFGLTHPNADIKLTLPDGMQEIKIGDNGPLSGTIYLQKGGDPRVLLAQQWIKGSLTRTVFDFRTKIILPIDHDKVDRLELGFPKIRFDLARKDKEWRLTKPIDTPADDDALNNLTLMLQNLRANFFIDPGPDRDKAMKALKRPLVTVVTHEPENNADRPQTARFYDAPEKQDVYVVTEPDKPIYRVARTNMDELKPDLFHYQDKRLLAFKPDDVKGIAVRSAKEQYTLELKSDAWVMKNEKKPVRQEAVTRFLDQIQKLKAFQPVESRVKKPAKVGLGPSVREIRLLDQNRKTLAALDVGNELKGMLYAKGNTKLGIAMINKDFLDEIPRKSELTKKPEPPKGPKPAAKKKK
jgi:Domain of unknown function (DUF4340)